MSDNHRHLSRPKLIPSLFFWFHVSTLAGHLDVFLVSSLFVAEKLAGVFKPVLASMRLFLFSMKERTRTVESKDPINFRL